jgi:chaperonin cofactor prefoldin
MAEKDPIQQILDRHGIEDPSEFLLRSSDLERQRRSFEERLQQMTSKLKHI